MPIIGTPVSPVDPITTGYHAMSDMVENRGAENIRSWSNKGADGDTDVVAVNRSIRDSKSQIDSKLRKRFVYPFVSLNLTVMSQSAADTLNRISETLGSYALYAARGLDVEDDPDGSVLRLEREDVMKELDGYVDQTLFIDLQTGDEASATSPQAVVVDPLMQNPYFYRTPGYYRFRRGC